MSLEDVWDHDVAQGHDTPGEGMFAPEMLGSTVDRLAELAGDGRALEFAIGTGRVAIPLAGRGVVSYHFRFGAGKQARLWRSRPQSWPVTSETRAAELTRWTWPCR